MKNNIYIIGFFDYSLLNQKRISSQAAINKINYIASSLSNNNNVKIISPSWTNEKKFYKSKNINIKKNVNLIYFYTIPWFFFLKPISIIFSKIQLLLYILLCIPKNSTIIIYHSMYLINVISLLKKMKKYNIILEVEEIYSDVKNDLNKRKKELKYLQLADKYIFITEMLNKEVNKKDKPYIICHGTYNYEKKLDRIVFNDNKIHCVYAGTFDFLKGGVLASIDSAQYLSNNYCIHILGFGSEEQIDNVKEIIDKVNNKKGARVIYEGLKTGEDYIRFIQSCDIGLSTQNPDAAFNATSFPSKILSYMSNGLRVVSIRIPAIETSDIGKYMYYYDKQTPKDIANAIMNVNLKDDYDSRKIVKDLDKKFKKDLKELLDE